MSEESRNSAAAQSPSDTHVESAPSITPAVSSSNWHKDGIPSAAVSESAGEPATKRKAHWLEQDVHVIPKNNLWIVFPALMLCVFLAALDQTIVSTALPTISNNLHSGAAGYSWVGTAYLLTATAMIPLYGRLSDIVGRKPLFFIAIFLFLFGSAMCGAAQNIIWLCCCRGVQGIGGGGIIGLCQVVTSDIVPLHKRGSFQGLFGAVWGVACVIGPLIGGALTDHGGSLGWRWCFLINLPIGAVAAAMLFFSLHLNPTPRRSPAQLAREFDFVGYLVLLAAIVIFLFGFSEAETGGFSEARTIALIVVGACLFPVAIGWTFWCEKHLKGVRPILPPRLFRTRTTVLILITVILHGFPFFAVTYEMPIYFQAVKGASATLSGVYMLPYALVGSIVSAVSGVAVVKLKAWRPVFWYGWLLSAIGYSLMTLIDAESSWAEIECTTLVAGLGYGALFQVPLLGLLSAMPQSEQAATTSTLGLVRSMSGSMGISVAGAIFNTRAKSLTAGIVGYQTPENPSADLRGLVDIQPPSLSKEVIHEYGRALNLVWVILAPIVALGFLCALPVKSYSLNRQHLPAIKERQEGELVPTEKEAAAQTSRLSSAGGREAGADTSAHGTNVALADVVAGASSTQPTLPNNKGAASDTAGEHHSSSPATSVILDTAAGTTAVPSPVDETDRSKIA
ncbi:unnamed protein product [Parajaminaea phylloscopi]